MIEVVDRAGINVFDLAIDAPSGSSVRFDPERDISAEGKESIFKIANLTFSIFDCTRASAQARLLFPYDFQSRVGKKYLHGVIRDLHDLIYASKSTDSYRDWAIYPEFLMYTKLLFPNEDLYIDRDLFHKCLYDQSKKRVRPFREDYFLFMAGHVLQDMDEELKMKPADIQGIKKQIEYAQKTSKWYLFAKDMMILKICAPSAMPELSDYDWKNMFKTLKECSSKSWNFEISDLAFCMLILSAPEVTVSNGNLIVGNSVAKNGEHDKFPQVRSF